MIKVACVTFTNIMFKNINHSDISFTYFDNIKRMKYDEFSVIFLVNHRNYNAPEIIKHIRTSFSSTVYFIDLEYDEKIMMELFLKGIDDYIVAPIYPKYLINKILHDTKAQSSTHYVYKSLDVQYKKYRALVNNKDVNLTNKEYLILELLVKNVNNVVPKQDIIRSVWGKYNKSYLQTFDTHIKTLRRKLTIYRGNVVTLWGRGYAFIEQN